MSAIARMTAGGMSPAQISLARKTFARDCNDPEFDLFMATAAHARLDPFRKQISPLVFNKGDAGKRRMAIVTTIEGLRSIAARSGHYRPDSREPEYEFDPEAKDPKRNPLGLVKATVRAFTQDNRGEWFEVVGTAYWEEFAPLRDVMKTNDAGRWIKGEDGRYETTGEKILDLSGNWGRMPRLMLAKCAEAQALRKGWPEELSGLYEATEFDRQVVLDQTASEVVSDFDQSERLKKIGGSQAVMIQFDINAPIERIPLGQVADRLLAHIDKEETYSGLRWWRDTNQHGLREFWALQPGDALAVKAALEKKLEALAPKDGETA